jgi:hypothetical protein
MVSEFKAERTGIPVQRNYSAPEVTSRPSTSAKSSNKYPIQKQSFGSTKLPKMESKGDLGTIELSSTNEIPPFNRENLSLDFSMLPQQQTNQVETEENPYMLQMNKSSSHNDFSKLKLSYGSRASTSNRPISPGLQKTLMALDPPSPLVSKKDRHAIACQSVSDQAFRRCLFTVEEQALYDAEMDEKIRKRQHELEMREKNKREKLAADMIDLKKTLDHQIIEAHKRRIPISTTTQTSLVLDPTEENLRDREDQKKNLLNFLNGQINNKRDKKEMDKHKKLMEESKYLEHVAMEFDLENTIERAKHLEQQRALLEDWERAAHIRSLKKLKGTEVVKNYVTENFTGGNDEISTPSLSASRKFNSLGASMSIGFDARKN